jgi:hypothetical protein
LALPRLGKLLLANQRTDSNEESVLIGNSIRLHFRLKLYFSYTSKEMTNEPEPEPRPPTSQPNAGSSTVTQLIAIRQELRDLKEQELRELKQEVADLRSDLTKKILPSISGQVACGIIQALLLLCVLGFFLQLLLWILSLR